ncbi:MAG: TIGR04283 family arsenosugar biosynthesis glycosyltransferase [Deltaproteobacteria bacterium]|nr:TIGR04283 family arsenosugar biosynthesis glycosyltransferase [Deltaproteobacteria bacterium]
MVIPALDEADQIAGAVSSAAGPEVDVIVVDGGSQDGTPERARSAGARVLNAQRGRARQLQIGFEASESDVVLFLHADTRLPGGWERAVAAALEDPETVGGAFRLRFDERDRRIRLVEFTARLRIALLAFPFGDQALFVRSGVLAEIGGVPDVPVMEDVDLVHAMKQRGKLALLPLPATTSARRYLEGGVGRVSVAHFLAFAGWALNVDRERLAGWLRR